MKHVHHKQVGGKKAEAARPFIFCHFSMEKYEKVTQGVTVNKNGVKRLA